MRSIQVTFNGISDMTRLVNQRSQRENKPLPKVYQRPNGHFSNDQTLHSSIQTERIKKMIF
tara:strand:- start:336 stop:518 length:183 start_codon:yes stop_codon:yes gene_type:complete